AHNADMTMSSSDGILFKVHRKNLTAHSVVFADAEMPPDRRMATISEPDVLDLLFQLMYPLPPPDVQILEFKIFAGLAEASARVQVQFGVRMCSDLNKISHLGHP
ncbi:hypothetical protein B0H19DRAFT_882146, partial [Mycena capillaripes]